MVRITLPERSRGTKRRPQRVAEVIQNEISAFLLRKVNDPRVAGVTITEVLVTDDLRQARIYYTVLGGEGLMAEAAVGLASAKGFIRSRIAQVLDLRYAPELEFRADKAAARGERIEQLFKEIADEHEESS